MIYSQYALKTGILRLVLQKKEWKIKIHFYNCTRDSLFFLSNIQSTLRL